MLYYNKGLYEEAVTAFMKALELDQKMQVAQRNLEIAYFNTGYYDARVAELKERLRVHPEDRDTRWELGRTFALLGQQEEAAGGIPRRFCGTTPMMSARCCNSAMAEKQAGDIEQAQHYLERAMVLDPASSLLHVTLGEVLYHRGLNDEALRALERAVDAQSGQPRRAAISWGSCSATWAGARTRRR